MHNVIIFSKNRPSQLDACLRSFFANCREAEQVSVMVLYTATSDEYARGYELCKTKNSPAIEWKVQRHELSFKKDLLHLFRGKEACPLTMFLVDDIIFREPFSFADPEISAVVENNHLLCCSLRLYSGITECYATSSPSKIPTFIKGNVWNWYGAEGDWGYPYSLDGNVYRTLDIIRKITNADYANPNQLEASLNVNNFSRVGLGTPDRPTYVICYVQGSKLVNIPANRVQDEFKNRVGNIMSPEEMNQKFLAGEQISLSTVADLVNSTVHVEIPIVWETQEKVG